MLTRDQFEAEYGPISDAVFTYVSETAATADALQAQVVALAAQVKELQDRLNKDSHNSSKPPSSDGYKKRPVSLRRKIGRKPGGQPGHPGSSLEFSNSPDQTVPHVPKHCRQCGTDLEHVASTICEKRQEFDIPPVRLHCTEHQSHSKCCPNCGAITQAEFPSNVEHSTQYGAQFCAMMLYLMQYQFVPFKRAAEFARDNFNAPVSEGTLLNILRRAHCTLAPVEAEVKKALPKKKILFCDETGARVRGKLCWFHSTSTPNFTHYSCQKHRGELAMTKIGILPKHKGRAIHDGWKAYFRFSCSHGLCNAHHLRELTGVHEQHKQQWAAKMITVLLEAKDLVAKAKAEGKKCLDPNVIDRLEWNYIAAIFGGRNANPPPEATRSNGRKKLSVGGCLVRRLDVYRKQTLAFIYDFDVPFDNNLAERDIRMMKLRQKISGCFRTEEGADIFCRLRGYISTMRKQGHNVLEVLHSVCSGTPLYPDLSLD